MLKINDLMKPYLIQLKERFTQYELLYTLAMKSQYSIHLYELLKSYEYQRDKTFEIEELKRLLFATGYTRYPDFIRFVVERATDEINRLSDLTVIWTPIKDGKRYAQINFTMKLKKNLDEKLLTWANIDEVISPEKISLYEKLNKTKPKTKNPKGRSKKSK
jgi:plasmid replication initiation protein